MGNRGRTRFAGKRKCKAVLGSRQQLCLAFPYGMIIGYRKGADGKPEIIPDQAEVIRLIFNSYLQGDSLQNIKKKLETAGAVTARGNTTWSSQAILRILQNEKYCGDVLLQKTFTEGVLTGTQKKNTGQLPQYYIENHHEGIVTKQVFREVQEEIAKRQSKNPANIRKKRKGRYNSRYALSGRLVCGECGSSYKRVTWDIHGRKEVVWRCANRAAYGTKFCKHSPSIPEEELHEAILKAIQELTDNFTAEVSAQLNGILQQIERGENSDTSLQTQLEQEQQEFDRLLELSLDLDEQTPFLDNKLKSTNEKIKALKRAISESAEKKKQTPSQLRISEKDLQIKEYDDTMTARIVESIKVKSRNGMSDAPVKPDKEVSRWNLIKAYLNDHSFIMNADVRALCGVSAATANRILAGLVRDGKLEKCRENSWWVYKRKAD